MSTPLLESARAVGLSCEKLSPDEWHARCLEDEFADKVAELAQRATLSDLTAWLADDGSVRLMAVLQIPGDRNWLVCSTDLSGKRFRSLTPRVHAASWYERELREMFGLDPTGHPSALPLRLHDWPSGLPPMDTRPGYSEPAAAAVPTSPVPIVHGQGVFQLPLGPVRSGPQESGEFLFNSGGEDLVMVSPRFGYKMRLVEHLAVGQTPDNAIILAERLAGTSGFSNALAFTQACERALGLVAGPASCHLRSLFNELERLHCHLGDLARLCDSTGMAVPTAQYAILKEEVLEACTALSGHRYLRTVLTLGGMNAVPSAQALNQLAEQAQDWLQRCTQLASLLTSTATFLDRLESTGVLSSAYANQHHLLGPVGRACTIDQDARRDHPYAAYAMLSARVAVGFGGDAMARYKVRLAEVETSCELIGQLVSSWPAEDGPDQLPERPGSALGWAEAPAGETLHWVVLDACGRILRWRARTPALVNWHPFAQACASGNNLTDYPVIEASFGLSHAEFDR